MQNLFIMKPLLPLGGNTFLHQFPDVMLCPTQLFRASITVGTMVEGWLSMHIVLGLQLLPQRKMK